MLRLRSSVSVLLCALLLPLAASAEPPQPPPPNAALLYWLAFAVRNSNEDQDRILANWKTVPWDEATMEILESGANSLRYLHRGAVIQRCDWGLPFDEGPNLLLPHLGKARNLAYLAALRARYDLEHVNPDAAIDRITDVLTLARHAGSDSLLFSLLVQYRIEAMAIDLAADHLSSLDTSARVKLAERLRNLPASGRIEECVRGERQFFIGHLIKALKAADPNSDWVNKIFVSTGALNDEEARAAIAAAGGTPESVLKCLIELDPIYDKLAQAIALPPDQSHAQFELLKKEFETNPMGKRFLPPLLVSCDQAARARARFVMLQAAIAVSLEGPDKLKEYPDPAGGGPFKYRPLAKGFELRSAVMYEDQPVVLIVR